MAYRIEKNESGGKDIVIDGWEKGIGSSPHRGIANIQNANISTELGEVTCSFVRENQVVQEAISGGTLTFDSSGGNTTLLGAPSTLQGGQWITVTAATAKIPQTFAPVSYLVVGGGGAGGGSNAGASSAAVGGGGSGGEVKTGSGNVSVQAYSVTVGAGGTSSNTDGGDGSSSSFGSVATAVGGGGGGSGAANGGAAGNGATGAYGGGGGAPLSSGTAGTGATGSIANHGGAGGVGTSFPGSGGGGGAGGNGDSALSTGGGNYDGGVGGVGSSSSISGAAVFYGGGGGGVGNSGGASGGNGGGGSGTLGGVGVAGTANTGGGGGGGSRNGGGDTNHNGGNGGSGIVIISYPTGSVTATGGTITTSGGNTIHTFTSSGTFTVTAVDNPTTLPTGDYFVDFKNSTPQVKISEHYDPYGDNPVVFEVSGTITFDLTIVLGEPISKATEKYADATSTKYRYYILDDNGYVWVHDPDTTWEWGLTSNTAAPTFNNICVLNGQLFGLNTVQLFAKPTVDLGLDWVLVDNGYFNDPLPTHTNFALSGHQGRMYWCDSNYIGSLFPDTSIVTGANNVQSYCKYTASSTIGTVTEVLSGSVPYTTDSNGNIIRIPAVFFTDQNGTQPTNLTVDTIYYIDVNSIGTAQFGVYAASTGGSAINIATGASGNQYFNTFWPFGSDSGIFGATTTVTFSSQRVNLPAFEIAQTLAEVGNTVLIGCAGNTVYPWNQVDVTPSGLINLPEGNVTNMLTVNQVAYIFAGNQGNVYITDGSLASLALNLSDYLAGLPGSPGTYVESTYTWEDSMYLRGRVYFSVLDQSSSKTGNCGGVWSFVPTQNIDQPDLGLALRLEAQNSYNTYNGAAALLLPNLVQNAQQPLYWSAWYSSVSTPTYGIDYSTGGTSSSFPAIIETDAIPVGTMLSKKTFSQLEYKLGAPLDTNATITAKYRSDITSAWTDCPTFIVEPTQRLSGYVAPNFQFSQWLQFQFTLTPITSSASTNTFVRFREIRLRA